MARHRTNTDGVLVIGLGRFGASLAYTFESLGTPVLAVDTREERVQEHSAHLTHVVQADATQPEVLAELGAAEFSVAVVAVGSSIENSVLVAANLVDLEGPVIWAKAISASHGKILQRIGAHHVVFPEADAGFRVAHLVTGKLMDFIEFDDDFAIVKMRPPQSACGSSLAEARIRQRYGVTVVGVKSPGQAFTYAEPETMVRPGDVLIVAGETPKIEKFAEQLES